MSAANATAILTQQLNGLIASPAINANAISGFQAKSNALTQGVDLSFTLTDTTGIDTITLLRNFVLDAASATVLQSWQPMEADYTWSDTDTALQGQAAAYYWLVLSPVGTSGTALTVGPQSIELNPQLAAPVPATSISASHSAAVNGVVTVTVNVMGDAASQKIYVSGYKGNAALVAVAQQASSPLQFTLDATGENVTLEAIGVSLGGAEAASGPTTTLILNGTLTIPATPQGVVVAQISTGNQITFPASKDAGSTYKIYRAQSGQAFVAATLLATVTGTAGTIEYLDTAGLTSAWEYFVVATNDAGDSAPSAAATPPVLYTSAALPANVSGNTTNTATIDSVDAGTSALVRIYGPGGVGTSYSRLTGYGSLTRPNGTISGLAYSTMYGVMWTGIAFLAVVTYPATLPDHYEIVGQLTTTAPTGVSGSGATATAVINAAGNVIQVNPDNVGSGYSSATVSVAGGGGSGAQVIANVNAAGQITSYTVQNGGSAYATAPAVTVVGGTSTGTTGGGGSNGGTDGSRSGLEFDSN